MSTRIVLTRHGESEWHADNRYAGRSDIELTERGRSQAKALGEWAGDADLAAIYASPQRRAHESALPAAERAGLEIGVDDRLRELDFGVAEGRTRAEMDRDLPDDLAAFRHDPVTHHFRDGEKPDVAADRCLAALTEIATAHDGGRVLVVAHSTTFRLTLCRLLGLPLASYRGIFPHLDNCALNEIALDGDRVSLLSLNVPVTTHDRSTSGGTT